MPGPWKTTRAGVDKARALLDAETDRDEARAEVSRLREEVERLTRLRAADAEGAANIVARYNAQVAESARLTRELEGARRGSETQAQWAREAHDAWLALVRREFPKLVANRSAFAFSAVVAEGVAALRARLAEVERERDAAKAETEEYLRRFTLDLAEHETARERAESALATERVRGGKLEKAVARFLVAYPWQGNVPETRELRALLPREPMTGTYAALTPPATPEKPKRCGVILGRALFGLQWTCSLDANHDGPHSKYRPATPNPEEP